MQVRRLLLDGVKIIEPYRRVLLRSHSDNGKIDDKAVANEVVLMDVWIKMARTTALNLKRAAVGKSSSESK